MTMVRALVVILLLLIAFYSGLLALNQVDVVAAFFNGEISKTSRIVYAVIGIAALFSAVVIAFGDSKLPGRIGRASGDNRGPDPGDGAVIHHSSGEADFDGLPGNALPPIKSAQRDLPNPPGRSAD